MGLKKSMKLDELNVGEALELLKVKTFNKNTIDSNYIDILYGTVRKASDLMHLQTFFLEKIKNVSLLKKIKNVSLVTPLLMCAFKCV